jgi:hypothetical protein
VSQSFHSHYRLREMSPTIRRSRTFVFAFVFVCAMSMISHSIAMEMMIVSHHYKVAKTLLHQFCLDFVGRRSFAWAPPQTVRMLQTRSRHPSCGNESAMRSFLKSSRIGSECFGAQRKGYLLQIRRAVIRRAEVAHHHPSRSSGRCHGQ